MVEYQDHTQRRFNPLTEEWVLVSPHRAKRPWQGHREQVSPPTIPPYVEHCFMCPGNKRANHAQNPHYKGVFVFDNDFPALIPQVESEIVGRNNDPLFQTETERGICRVICFSPRHDWTLALMPLSSIKEVVDTWAEQTQQLAHDFSWLNNVQIFVNYGEVVGAGFSHPHGAIWATEHLPNEVHKEDRTQRSYFEKHGHTLLSQVITCEETQVSRLIYSNPFWQVFVPFWAVWPYEVILVSKRPVQTIVDLRDDERAALADAISNTTVRYDNLFNLPFPYCMGFHQAPVNSGNQPHWHLHAHFYPPLLNAPDQKKYMAAYELLASWQRDITPEEAAKLLREKSGTIHYSTLPPQY